MNRAFENTKNKCVAPDQENDAFASNSTDSTPSNNERKRFETLRAKFALVQHVFYRVVADDGSLRFVATRWGMIRELATLEDAERFLAQIGGSK